MVIKAKWNGNADVHMYTFTFFGIKLYGDLPKKSCSDPDVHMYTCIFFSTKALWPPSLQKSYGDADVHMYTFTFFSTKLYGHPQKKIYVTQMSICIHLPFLAYSSMVTPPPRATVTQMFIYIHVPSLA
jgi:hypothetical protein